MTNSTFEANKDFYHINLCENFKVEYIEHETEKSYLLRGEGFKFWCPKKLIHTNGDKDIRKWTVWNKFEANFIDVIDEKDPNVFIRQTFNKHIKTLSDDFKDYLENPSDKTHGELLDYMDQVYSYLNDLDLH